MACSSLLYNWSLGGCVPDGLAVKPADPWPGDIERGRWLCSGAFRMDGEQLDMHGDYWEPFSVGSAWYDFLHGFEWLRDLKALGGDQGRKQARSMVENWMRRYPRWHEDSWSPGLTGKRIAMWTATYDFFGESADDTFQEDFLDSLIRQSRHLGRSISGMDGGLEIIQASKGLVYAGASLAGFEQWIEQGLAVLERQIERQILTDGCHASRSPAATVRALQLLVDVRFTLLAARVPVPEKLQHAIDRMSPAIRFFRYADKGLALFNGTNEGDRSLLDTVLVHANARGKALRTLPHAGFERVTQGRSVLICDCGGPPAPPFDQEAHPAPLAFEFVHGRDRIFVNCGTHPTNDDWQDVLRGTAAHTALGINYRNAFEIREDGHFGRKARTVSCERQESDDACLLDASHDGYASLNGIIHRRRMFLTDNGGRLAGEETLTCPIGLGRSAEVAVRFHLHPRVNASLTQDGREALILLPGGTGWRFIHNAGELALEDSVYLGSEGTPRRSRQLVIYGVMESDFAQIKWSLRKQSN
ncbi:MAG: heparinase [Alphaproteobacteria bacterium]|nr:heparinase [Alphaproteobacteria bacterium]